MWPLTNTMWPFHDHINKNYSLNTFGDKVTYKVKAMSRIGPL